MFDDKAAQIEGKFHNISKSFHETEELKFTMEYTIVLSVLYTVAFLLSLFGNILVLITVWKNTHMHTVINYFICNLSVADIMTAVFCIPPTLLQNIFKNWIMGDLLCKLSPFLQGCAVNASVVTFTVVAFDRYLAIYFPMKRYLTVKLATGIIVAIWIYSASLFSPWIVHYNVVEKGSDGNATHNETEYNCFLIWPQFEKVHFFVVNVGLCYVVPFTLTAVCYVSIAVKVLKRTRRKSDSSSVVSDQLKSNLENAQFLRQSSGNSKEKSMKIVKMLVIVVVVFGVVWLPLLALASVIMLITLPENVIHTLIHYIPIAQWITYTNCYVNPWIYCIFSRNFRISFSRLLCPGSCSSGKSRHGLQTGGVTHRFTSAARSSTTKKQRQRHDAVEHNLIADTGNILEHAV